MTTIKTTPYRRRSRAERGPLDRLPAVAGLPDRADDRLRRLRQPAARRRAADDHARVVGRPRGLRAGRLARLPRDDDRRHARRLRRRPHRPPQRAARLHGAVRRRDDRRRTACTTSSTLGILRLLAGIGLGGAMPNAAALAAEYVPLRQRPFAVTLAIVCVPVGATLAGLPAIAALPTVGWRGLFIIGGATPIVAAAVLAFVMPESPRYLVRHPSRWRELAALLTPHGPSGAGGRRLRAAAGIGDRPAAVARRRSSAASCASIPSRCGRRSSRACSPSTSASPGCRRILTGAGLGTERRQHRPDRVQSRRRGRRAGRRPAAHALRLARDDGRHGSRCRRLRA